MKRKYTIPWGDYPKVATDMEVGLNGKRRNDNHLDVALDEIDERIIALDTSKVQNK